MVFAAERRFEAAGLYYGHGTDNARDEAVFLVFHALGLSFDTNDEALDRELSVAELARAEALVSARISSRMPAAYLTNRMWFAGHEFYVDQRVLIPRSPIAELILDHFVPWLSQAPRRILDIGTGSGCIAIAAAHAFSGAVVDAVDIEPRALEVAARNVGAHGLDRRVRLHQADLFPANGQDAYDLILANPPYVPHDEVEELPAEYRHEPCGALFADEDGMCHVRRILATAGARLNPGGILVMDVGGTWPAVDAAFPTLPFVWVELARGGDGICVLTQAELAQFALE